MHMPIRRGNAALGSKDRNRRIELDEQEVGVKRSSSRAKNNNRTVLCMLTASYGQPIKPCSATIDCLMHAARKDKRARVKLRTYKQNFANFSGCLPMTCSWDPHKLNAPEPTSSPSSRIPSMKSMEKRVTRPYFRRKIVTILLIGKLYLILRFP